MRQAHANAPTAMLLAARAPPGLGGTVLAGFADAFNKPAGRCVDCHTEHEGAGPMPATPQRFCPDCHDGMADRPESAGVKWTVPDAADVVNGTPDFPPTVRAGPGGQPVRGGVGAG